MSAEATVAQIKNVAQMGLVEFAEYFKANPKEALDAVARDYPNTFVQTAKSLLNIGESEAEKLMRIQQNGTGAICWEEKELLEKILRFASSHEASKKFAEEFRRKLEEEREAEASAKHNSAQSHGAGLPSGLGQMSHEAQVHCLAEFMMHGGSAAEIAKAYGVSQEGQEAIRSKEEDLREKYDEKHKSEREELEESKRRYGEESEEYKRRKKAYEERKTLAVFTDQSMLQTMQNWGVPADKISAAAKEAAAKGCGSDMSMRVSDEELHRLDKQSKIEMASLKAKLKNGQATEEDRSILKVAAVSTLGKEDVKKTLEANKDIKNAALLAYIKDDVDAVRKASALAIGAKGGFDDGDIDSAKLNLQASATLRSVTDEEEGFESSPAPINKDFLQRKRIAQYDAPMSAPKGPEA